MIFSKSDQDFSSNKGKKSLFGSVAKIFSTFKKDSKEQTKSHAEAKNIANHVQSSANLSSSVGANTNADSMKAPPQQRPTTATSSTIKQENSPSPDVTSTAEVESAAKHESKIDIEEQSDPKPKANSKLGAKLEVEAQVEPKPTVEMLSEQKPEDESLEKVEFPSESKTEDQIKAKINAQSEDKLEAQSTSQEAKLESNTETKQNTPTSKDPLSTLAQSSMTQQSQDEEKAKEIPQNLSEDKVMAQSKKTQDKNSENGDFDLHAFLDTLAESLEDDADTKDTDKKESEAKTEDAAPTTSNADADNKDTAKKESDVKAAYTAQNNSDADTKAKDDSGESGALDVKVFLDNFAQSVEDEPQSANEAKQDNATAQNSDEASDTDELVNSDDDLSSSDDDVYDAEPVDSDDDDDFDWLDEDDDDDEGWFDEDEDDDWLDDGDDDDDDDDDDLLDDDEDPLTPEERDKRIREHISARNIYQGEDKFARPCGTVEESFPNDVDLDESEDDLSKVAAEQIPGVSDEDFAHHPSRYFDAFFKSKHESEDDSNSYKLEQDKFSLEPRLRAKYDLVFSPDNMVMTQASDVFNSLKFSKPGHNSDHFDDLSDEQVNSILGWGCNTTELNISNPWAIFAMEMTQPIMYQFKSDFESPCDKPTRATSVFFSNSSISHGFSVIASLAKLDFDRLTDPKKAKLNIDWSDQEALKTSLNLVNDVVFFGRETPTVVSRSSAQFRVLSVLKALEARASNFNLKSTFPVLDKLGDESDYKVDNLSKACAKLWQSQRPARVNELLAQYDAYWSDFTQVIAFLERPLNYAMAVYSSGHNAFEYELPRIVEPLLDGVAALLHCCVLGVGAHAFMTAKECKSRSSIASAPLAKVLGMVEFIHGMDSFLYGTEIQHCQSVNTDLVTKKMHHAWEMAGELTSLFKVELKDLISLYDDDTSISENDLIVLRNLERVLFSMQWMMYSSMLNLGNHFNYKSQNFVVKPDFAYFKRLWAYQEPQGEAVRPKLQGSKRGHVTEVLECKLSWEYLAFLHEQVTDSFEMPTQEVSFNDGFTVMTYGGKLRFAIYSIDHSQQFKQGCLINYNPSTGDNVLLIVRSSFDELKSKWRGRTFKASDLGFTALELGFTAANPDGEQKASDNQPMIEPEKAQQSAKASSEIVIGECALDFLRILFMELGSKLKLLKLLPQAYADLKKSCPNLLKKTIQISQNMQSVKVLGHSFNLNFDSYCFSPVYMLGDTNPGILCLPPLLITPEILVQAYATLKDTEEKAFIFGGWNINATSAYYVNSFLKQQPGWKSYAEHLKQPDPYIEFRDHKFKYIESRSLMDWDYELGLMDDGGYAIVAGPLDKSQVIKLGMNHFDEELCKERIKLMSKLMSKRLDELQAKVDTLKAVVDQNKDVQGVAYANAVGALLMFPDEIAQMRLKLQEIIKNYMVGFAEFKRNQFTRLYYHAAPPKPITAEGRLHFYGKINRSLDQAKCAIDRGNVALQQMQQQIEASIQAVQEPSA